MKIRRLNKLIWWLLPLLALRGLVPAGFMLDTSHGQLAIVVCPGHIPAATPVDHADHAGHFGKEAPDDEQSRSTLCPFALSAGPAPLTSLAAVVAGAPVDVFESVDHQGPELPFGPARTHHSRAPPSLS